MTQIVVISLKIVSFKKLGKYVHIFSFGQAIEIPAGILKRGDGRDSFLSTRIQSKYISYNPAL